jgi:hypothetical protein
VVCGVMWKSRASFDSERDQRWAHMEEVGTPLNTNCLR